MSSLRRELPSGGSARESYAAARKRFEIVTNLTAATAGGKWENWLSIIDRLNVPRSADKAHIAL